MKLWAILAMIAITLVACAPTPVPQNPPAALTTETPPRAPTLAPTQTPGRETKLNQDPQNATYLIEGEAITLVNGIAETVLVPGSASTQVTTYFGNEIEIDLNADGLLDTAFLLEQASGGSGTFFYVAVALKTADGYVGTNAVFLGDRIAPQSTSLDPNHPLQFVVSYGARAEAESMSSEPTHLLSRTFTLDGGTLLEVETSSR